jgi:hypothetical protein
MDRRWGFTVALVIMACGSSRPTPAPPPAPAPEPEPAAEARQEPPPPSVEPLVAPVAEGPDIEGPPPGGACAEYVALTLRCMEKLAAAGTFPVDQLDQVRQALEQTLTARADASEAEREAMDRACQVALEQQPWQQSGCP